MKRASPVPKANWPIILERLALGNSLRSICRDLGISESDTRYHVTENPEMFAQYARARNAGFDALADQAIEIADDKDEDANSRRVRIDARKWYLSKLRPDKYGDMTRTELSGPAGGPVQNKLIVEIVRPLALQDGEDPRKARVPARTIDAE